jgi:hypothetical protein
MNSLLEIGDTMAGGWTLDAGIVASRDAMPARIA